MEKRTMPTFFSSEFWISFSWLEVVAAALTIIGIPYAIFYTLLRLFYRAKHRIHFKEEETYPEVTLRDRPNEPQSFWLQVMVKNSGFEVSRSAEAYLSKMWKQNAPGQFEEVKDFKAPVKLKWSHEADIYPIDILPRESRRLDVCFICQNESNLYLMTKGFPSGSIKNIIGPGTYIFLIKVVSLNGLLPASFFLRIEWDGQWRTLQGAKYLKSFRMMSKPIQSFKVYSS